MDLKTAQDIAVKICYKLQPYCDKINIAGSVRRKKPEPKDLEIVCLPKTTRIESFDLFGGSTETYIQSPEFGETVGTLGKIVKGHYNGKYMAIELPEGINLDLFMPDSWDFYRQFCIRTGSASFVQQNIAVGWRRKGYCGSDKGLRLMKDCSETKDAKTGKSTWKCINPKAEKPPIWDSEKQFFKWLNIPYVEPQYRI